MDKTKGNSTNTKLATIDVLKFFAFGAIAVFVFFCPINVGGRTTIPIEYLVSTLIKASPQSFKLYAFVTIIIASIMPFYRKTWNKTSSNIFFTISKVIGAIVSIMVFFQVGPNLILQKEYAPFLFNVLAINVGAMFLFGAMFLTFLIDYGFIDFVGHLVRPFMRRMCKTPGRSAVDAVTSFVGSTGMGIMVTNIMYTNRKYTTREAAIIATGFSLVDISFMIVVVKTIGLMNMWIPFFVTALVVTFMVTAVTARIYPLSKLPDTYYLNEEGYPEEEIEGNLFSGALGEGVTICNNGGKILKNVSKNLKNGFGLALEVLPHFMSIGLFGLLLVNKTPVFDYLGYAFYPLTLLLQIPDALLVAKAAFIGVAEMYLPVLTVINSSDFVKYVVSLLTAVQVIKLASTVPLIAASNIPLTIKDIVIISVERTILALIFITPIAAVTFKFFY